MNILLIEDNEDDAHLIGRKLRMGGVSGGFTVTHETLLSDGLEKLGSASFDLVLLDMGLPDSKGPTGDRQGDRASAWDARNRADRE
ncbi:MAG: DNA-binding response OmpR family regulator [Verrucomicrobiales bacterium]